MTRLIGKEWGYDHKGRPIRYHVYMAALGDPLPQNAPVGSRAVFEDGSIVIKTPSGWPAMAKETS